MSKNLFDNFNSTYHQFVFKDLLPVVLINNKSKLIVDANTKALATFNISLPYQVPDELMKALLTLDKHKHKRIELNGKFYFIRLHPIENIGADYTYLRIIRDDNTFNSILSLDDSFYQNNIIPMVLLDSFGKIVSYNKRFTEIDDSDTSNILNTNLFDYISCKEHDSFDAIAYVLENSELLTISEASFANSKSDKSYDLILNPFFINGILIGTQVSFIYNRISMDDEKNIATIFQLLVRNLNDGVMILTSDFKAVYINEKYTQITGYSTKDRIGKKIKVIDPNYNDSNQTYMFEERIKHFGTFQGESWLKRRDGNVTPVWVNVFSIYNSRDEVYRRVIIFKDLGDVDSTNSRFLSLIQKDPLTALYNRYIYIERVTNRLTVSPNEKQWVLLIDVNNFKPINDDYGHHVGDKVLALFARRLKQVFLGHLTARYGGDEFLVYFGANNDEKKVQNLIQNLYNDLKEPFIVDNNTVNLKISIGVARYPENGKTVYELLQYADNQMYLDKEKGKKEENIKNEAK